MDFISAALERSAEAGRHHFSHAEAPSTSSIFFSSKDPRMPIHTYLERLHAGAGFTVPAAVVAFALIERAVKAHQTTCPSFVLTPLNVHRLLAAAGLIALKTQEDRPPSNRTFAAAAGFGLHEMNSLEVALLGVLNWATHIGPEEYEHAVLKCAMAAE